jgi:glycosyltransferase involved in cell wall biosynthesis
MNNERPTLSIVIPAFNAEATLGEQIAALRAAMDDTMELIVVDNRSTDRTRAVAEHSAGGDERVRVIDGSTRQGEPHARNVGLAAARSDLIAFCDADDIASAEWPAAMRSALQAAEFVTGPVELDRLNPPWLAGFRGRVMFATIPVTVNDIPFAHGCNFGVRKRTAEALGGWDEDLRMGCDVIFSMRAHQAGVELGWAPTAVVHYRHRVGLRQRWRQAMTFGRALENIYEVAGQSFPLRRRVCAQGRRLGWLLKTAPKLVSRAHRARWCWTLATAIGEIRGDWD